MVTQPGGIVLDPYSGSGTTCAAAVLEGMNFVGIDKYAPYVERARIRIEMARKGEFGGVKKRVVKEPETPVEPTKSETTINDLLDLALSME